jgi:hypothetical protein
MIKQQTEPEPKFRRWRRRVAWWAMALVVAPLLGSAVQVGAAKTPHWSTASHEATGQAPDPATTPEAVIQIYAARAWGWRGVFAVHSWIAVKPADAPIYTRFEVIGWRAYAGRPPLRVSQGNPDNEWFSNRPELLGEVRGAAAEAIIVKVVAAIKAYPYADTYRTWPGPNSNTFTAYVTRKVPELGVELPVTAIGKDYLPDNAFIGRAPSGSGLQLSLGGLAGVLFSPKEGVEINILGAAFGIDFDPPALKLPGIGRLGWRNGG